ISSPQMVGLCRNKNFTSDFFVKCGLNAPSTCNDILNYTGDYPCFIKPKDGSSSINAFKVKDRTELEIYARMIGDYVIQSFIDGTEYTVDIFCGFDGEPIFITPRIREAVRAGEVLKTRICNDQTIIDEMRKLVSEFKPCGPITVQLIRSNKDGKDYYIEINPRYGGGAPLSMKAGADSAAMLIRMLNKEAPEYYPNAACDSDVYSRFDQSVRIGNSEHKSFKGVIFDLDDTLYPEKAYIKSGYKKIAGHLGDVSYADTLFNYFDEGKQAINELLKDIGRETEIDECIKIYRDQEPDITLYPCVKDLIKELRDNGIKVGIITDGRVNGQQNKLKALGLTNILNPEDIIITDELGGPQFRKPNDIAFRIMQNRWRIPFENIVYIGDNISKDLQAPLQLGMHFIYFENSDGIYPRKGSVLEVKTIKDLKELYGELLNE
ncbi:MAG: ATP-grasp domain-containing protein, partial [Lachnospiraceae bacterium]|nr:ATP-grasp domain-containing protein [Lachnospiraceae bacterium]